MEIVAVVSGGIAALSLIAWLVYGRIAAANTLQAMDDERDKAVQENASLKYELASRDKKIADQERTITALLKEPSEKPNADLAPDDDDTRLLRAAEEARASAGSPVPAGASGAVHPPSAGSDTAAAEVLPARPNDRLLDPDEHLL
jgi:hypothetical protein